MRAVLPLLFFALTGCSYYLQPEIDEVDVTLRIVDEFPGEPLKYGETECYKEGNYCILTIRRDVYPGCFVHEIRHAMEGEWHSVDRPNSMYCKPSRHPRRPKTRAEFEAKKQLGRGRGVQGFWRY